MSKLNLSALHTCVEHAQAYVAHKSAADRKAIREQVAAKAAASKKIRWSHLLKSIDAGDMTRIEARATGDWTQVKPVTALKPKASKPASKAASKPATAKPARKTQASMADLARQIAESIPEQDRVAFFQMVLNAK